MTTNNEEWTISYKQLGVIIASFSIGLIVALLISNSQGTSQSNFTTTELISFVLSVILSGASIVLAIAAISLGKVSEKSVIERSDESIRLQNEVFVKTTEALLRIESSTGVTEKRIEDIISGRVGDISHQVAQVASRHSSKDPLDIKKLEETIKKSLLNEVRSDSPEERKARQIKRREQEELEKKKEELYLSSHDNILIEIGNIDAVKIEKMGHGTIDVGGANFDGLFSKGNIKFAVSTFRPDSSFDSLVAFIPTIVEELTKLDLSHAFFVLFTDGNSGIDTSKLMTTMNFIRPEILEKITLINVELDKPSLAISTIIEKL